MANSLLTQIGVINRWVYQYYSRKEPVQKQQPVAWVSSFVPVEILEAMDIAYLYPESYAAVIAASKKEDVCLQKAQEQGISLDCCSYSAAFMGSLALQQGPRGIPVKPDFLIVSNNQCNTLPNWWNLLADQLQVPLFVLDYPGEQNADANTANYVMRQHKQLIAHLEEFTNYTFTEHRLEQVLKISAENVNIWNRILELFSTLDIMPSVLFDYISPLILARCRVETTEFLVLLEEELSQKQKRNNDAKRIYWAGYPLWYHPKRYFPMDGMQIVGADYLSWWGLDYSGKTVWDKLYHAYNFTFLNLSTASKAARLIPDILNSHAQGVVINHNKSCKRDFASLQEAQCPIPFAVIETDMIDRAFLDAESTRERIALLLEIL